MATTNAAPGHDLTRVTLNILGIGLLIGGSFWVLRPFLGALVWATTIVVATWPMLLGIQSRLGGRRGPAVALMTLALLLVVFVPLYLAVSVIIEQSDRIAALVRMLPTLQIPPPPRWIADLPLVGPRAAERWAAVAEDPQQLKEALAPRLKGALAWFGAQAGSFGGMVLHFLLTVALSAVLYAKGEAAAAQVRRFFRRLSGAPGDAIVTLAGKAIRAVALGVVVTAAVQATIVGIGLAVTRVPFAGLLAAVSLILCIAQLGPILAVLPGVIWLYASGATGRGTVLLVVMLGAQAIDNILRPFLIRKGGADLSLLLIIGGVIGGLLWLGVLGLFIGPVILAVTATLLDGWIESGLGQPGERGTPVASTTAPAAGGQVTQSR